MPLCSIPPLPGIRPGAPPVQSVRVTRCWRLPTRIVQSSGRPPAARADPYFPDSPFTRCRSSPVGSSRCPPGEVLEAIAGRCEATGCAHASGLNNNHLSASCRCIKSQSYASGYRRHLRAEIFDGLPEKGRGHQSDAVAYAARHPMTAIFSGRLPANPSASALRNPLRRPHPTPGHRSGR